MRIAMFSDNFYPELSGISDSIMTTGKELARRGHEIAYYAPRYSPKDYAVMHLPDVDTIGPRTSIHRLPAVRFKAGTGTSQAVIPVLASFPSLKRFDPDIIHFHHIFGAGLEAVFESRILKKPLVETNHTPILEFADYSPIKTEWFKRLLVHYDAWFYNRADFVSSPTRLIFENMKYANPAIPHSAISNPIDANMFRPAKYSQKNVRPFTILYAGRLAEEKKIDVVIRAVAQARTAIPDIRMIIVGRGACEAQLRSLATTLGMERAITFVGFVPSNRLISYYAQSDVFGIMSTSETQSIVAMQALACAIPVIAADAWGLKEYIAPEVGFRIKPGDVHGVAEKIILLYRNPDLRKRMGEEGQRYVSRFSIANIATTWEHIYRDVIARYNERT